MPNVIADTSPLQYLHQASLLHLLPALYDHIVVPDAVAVELERGIFLGLSLPDVRALPWIRVERRGAAVPMPLPADFGPGEREVVALAQQTPDALALIDDARARHYARRLGIKFTGTLGILLKARQHAHLAAVLPAIQALESLGFYLDPATRAAVLRLAGEGPAPPA